MLRHSVPHFPPDFSRQCVLSGGLFALVPESKIKILINDNSFHQMGIKPITVTLQSYPSASALRRSHLGGVKNIICIVLTKAYPLSGLRSLCGTYLSIYIQLNKLSRFLKHKISFVTKLI